MGVPQGSILGPALFNLYTHDIPQSPHTNIALYADDAAVLATSHADFQVGRYLQVALDRLADFYRRWRLKVNESKTEGVMFTHRNIYTLPQVRMGRETVEWSNEVKYLGVILDSKLTWCSHIKRAADKAKAGTLALYPIFNRHCALSVQTKQRIYKQLIRPVLTYACPVWNSAAQTHHNRAQRIQNRAFKIIYDTHPRQNLSRLHIQVREDTLLEHCMELTRKFYKSIDRHDNPLIRDLGRYTIDELPFRYRHRMPKHRLLV
jgi:hypothetical protein